ncbi:hypothetical protein L1887_58799 [Cichorium endivia]|nr:hypothetical protein L1887_58799 [Cichorium endivia]
MGELFAREAGQSECVLIPRQSLLERAGQRDQKRCPHDHRCHCQPHDPLPPIPRQAALQFPPQIPLPSIPSEGQQELVTVASSSSSSQSNGHVTRQTNGQSRQAQVSRTMERILDRLNGTRSSPTENSASSSENNYESLAAAASSQQDIPRPSSSNCPTGSNGQQVLSLRESQIVTLRKEINNPGGVRLKIRKVDCVDSLALVEWLGRIFIAGWKQKTKPADPLRQTDVNWAITEINFRPCNLFFKGDEIKNRLNSVGPRGQSVAAAARLGEEHQEAAKANQKLQRLCGAVVQTTPAAESHPSRRPSLLTLFYTVDE